MFLLYTLQCDDTSVVVVSAAATVAKTHPNLRILVAKETAMPARMTWWKKLRPLVWDYTSGKLLTDTATLCKQWKIFNKYLC